MLDSKLINEPVAEIILWRQADHIEAQIMERSNAALSEVIEIPRGVGG
tara:strand:- start:748 stop:891 length:144 start_codon:yes stop_codon:yes gene_type:complete